MKTKSFILSITTYNRLVYLKELINSWLSTKSEDVNWHIIIADDGSTDGTIDFVENLSIEGVQISLIKNNRFGVHQQTNTIIKKLSELNFDICFKVDDDIEFLKSGWDELYYNTVIQTGYEHLVFCDDNWENNQFLEIPVIKDNLIGKTSLLNSHGFLYTITPAIIEKVGYFNSEEFGFRGMGHVDFTARCCRAGFNDINNPYDIINSNDFLTAKKDNYLSSINQKYINIYDKHNRSRKDLIILNSDNIYIPLPEIENNLYLEFKDNLIESLVKETESLENTIEELHKVNNWFKTEIEKIKNYYNSKYELLPIWYKKFGNLLTKKQ